MTRFVLPTVLAVVLVTAVLTFVPAPVFADGVALPNEGPKTGTPGSTVLADVVIEPRTPSPSPTSPAPRISAAGDVQGGGGDTGSTTPVVLAVSAAAVALVAGASVFGLRRIARSQAQPATDAETSATSEAPPTDGADG